MYKIIKIEKEALRRIPKRKKDAHKGTYKKLLIIAGSKGMSGAAYLSAEAAYRTGAGLVKIISPHENLPILQNLVPEALVSAYDEEEIKKDRNKFISILRAALEWADIAVLGPGIGEGEAAAILTEEVLSRFKKPLVLDADGINLTARQAEWKQYLGEHVIITPHPKEMSRLGEIPLEAVLRHPMVKAKEFSEKYKTVTVLKLSESIVVDGKTIYANTSGSPALAKAGSGDVLSGIIGGLLCLGLKEGEAAALGVYIHGLAGEAAAKLYGEHGVLARDLIREIANVMKGI